MMNIGLKMGKTVSLLLCSQLFQMGAVICGDKEEILLKILYNSLFC